jgi:hypothetical protein
MLLIVAGEQAALRQEFIERQTEKGKQGAEQRWKKTASRVELDAIIRRLSRQKDELGDPVPARELWDLLPWRDGPGWSRTERVARQIHLRWR